MTSESKCPVAGGGTRMRSNSDWWPEQLNLKGPAAQFALVDPMGEEFDYVKEFAEPRPQRRHQ